MDKILSIQTIKNVFAALGAKTSDSNYAVGLFDKTSAEPKGIMGMSDLASVLGGAEQLATGVRTALQTRFGCYLYYFELAKNESASFSLAQHGYGPYIVREDSQGHGGFIYLGWSKMEIISDPANLLSNKITFTCVSKNSYTVTNVGIDETAKIYLY